VTADPRLTAAREFLAGARRRKIGELPPSVLAREAAELRRQLGQVLDLIGEDGAILPGPELQAVLGALDHAAVFLEERAEQHCDACVTHPAGACESHVDDLDQAGAYRALAGRLNGRQAPGVPPIPIAGVAAPYGRPVPWELTVRQALIDAINWREKRPDHPDAADQVKLYIVAARALGIDLGPGGAS
jgi:hypothetical protein